MDLFEQSARDAAIDQLHAHTALYTAEPIVDDLLKHLDWPHKSQRLVDSSCGDGMFIGRALIRLLRTDPGIKQGHLTERLEGWEVHRHAAMEARRRISGILKAHRWPEQDSVRIAAQIIRHADFLTEGPDNGPYADILVGNPPYIRWQRLMEPLKSEYRLVVPEHATGDLLFAFLDRCSRLLAPGGRIAQVTSDRWLFNSSSAKLRSELGRKLGITHLKRLNAESAFYRPKMRKAGTPPRVHPVAVILTSAENAPIPLTAAPIYPDATDAPAHEGLILGNIAEIRLAPWLGTAGIFNIDAQTASRLPKEHLVPAVDTDDIIDGVLQTPKRFALRTFAGHKPPEAIMQHLERCLPRMPERGRRNPAWLPPETWTQRDLSWPSLLVPRIARTLKPVKVPPGVLAVNHNLTIVTTSNRTLDDIQVLLSSPEAETWIRARAPRLENGFFALTTTLLRQLPVLDQYPFVQQRKQEEADAILSALTAAGYAVKRRWQPIKTAPRDRLVEVYAPSPDPERWTPEVHDLPPIVCLARWHPDGGFCVCEIREVTHWREHIPPAGETTP